MLKNKISWWKINFDNYDKDYLLKAFNSRKLSQGPFTQILENKIKKKLNVKYSCAVTSGTSSLMLAIYSLGLKPGDEVIVPNRTWVATAHAAKVLGLKVVLCDVKKSAPIIDETKISKLITKKTKAIICVHLNGRACDVYKIKKIIKKKNIFIIEDSAQAFFSKNGNKYLGTYGDIGCFSFAMTKILPTGQGGLIVTNKKNLFEKIKLIKNHGVVDNFTEKWERPGFNFKFSDILASIGISQFSKIEKRKTKLINLYLLYKKLTKNLKDIRIIDVNIKNGEVPLYIEAFVNKKKEFLKFMNSKGVQIRPLPPNLSEVDYFEKRMKFSNSFEYVNKGIYLPCGPDQKFDDIRKVVNLIKNFYKN